MFNDARPIRRAGLILLISLSGCAHAYHAYPCGFVSYGYCPDPPLPYTSYAGCPTPVASGYVSRQNMIATPAPAP